MCIRDSTYPDGSVVGADAASFDITSGNGFDNTAATTYTFTVNEIRDNCVGSSVDFTVQVNAEPSAIAGNDGNPICAGSAKMLTADFAGTGATYDWYLDGGDGNADLADDVFVSNDQNPLVTPTADANYFVVVTSADDCVATSNMTTVTVNTVADATTPMGQTICENELLTTPLSASTTATGINWYSAATGGLSLGTGTTYTPPSANTLTAGTYSYFAESYDAAGCVSVNRLEVVLTVTTTPTAPTVADAAICENGTVATVTPVGMSTGSMFQITYPDGTVIATAAASFDITSINGFDNSVAGNYTFIVSEVAGSCVGAPTSFEVNVSPEPMVAAGSDGLPICEGNTKSLTAASAGAGATFEWYEDLTGNGATADDVLVATTQNATVNPNTTTEYYYIVTTAGGCESAASNAVEVTVNTVADATSPTDQTICEGTFLTSSLEATTTATGINWYNTPTGGTQIGTGTSFTPSSTNALAAGTYSYYAESYDATGCVSNSRLEVVLTVTETLPAPMVADIEVCDMATVPTLHRLE